MPRLGKSSKAKGYRGEVQAVRDLNKRFIAIGSDLRAYRTIGSGAFATRTDGHADPTLQGDVQIRRPNHTIVEYIEIKVADPNRQAGPIGIAEMDGKNWREGRRLLMCRHVPGNRDWLCSMWPTPWDDLCHRGGKEPSFVDLDSFKTRGVNLHHVADSIRHAGGLPVWWGSGFYMTLHKLCSMLEAAYGEPDG